MPFILGGLIAYLLYRPVRFIERQGLGRVWAILLLYMLIIIALGLFFLSPCQNGGRTYGNGTAYSSLCRRSQHMADRLQNLDIPVRLGEIIKDNIARMNKYIYEGLQTFVGGLYSFLGKVLAIIFSPILAFLYSYRLGQNPGQFS